MEAASVKRCAVFEHTAKSDVRIDWDYAKNIKMKILLIIINKINNNNK